MSLDYIGPIRIDHRNPRLEWTSDADPSGIRTANISGQSLVASVQQLSELVSNPDLFQTVGAHSGVLAWVHTTGPLVGVFRGLYLLRPGSVSAERPWSVTPFMPFSLSGAYLGDGAEVVYVHSWRTVPNGHGFIGTPAAYNPFSGGELVIGSSIEGTVREADELLPHNVARGSEPLT